MAVAKIKKNYEISMDAVDRHPEQHNKIANCPNQSSAVSMHVRVITSEG